MKKNNHNLTDSPEKKQYKKRYLLRKIEEKESDETISSFTLDEKTTGIWERIVDDLKRRGTF